MPRRRVGHEALVPNLMVVGPPSARRLPVAQGPGLPSTRPNGR